VTKADQYTRGAERWTETQYASATAYLDHRAELIVSLGDPIAAGDVVLDLACGDGGLGDHLLARGLGYRGVDYTPEMVAEASRRLGNRAEVEVGDLNDYVPPAPVAVTTCFRAIYYAEDRRAFFAHVAGYTERKLVFDLNPRQYALEGVLADLRAAGFARIDLRPFFSPQRVALPRPLAAGLTLAERSGLLARLALRFRFSYICAASRGPRATGAG
jgi:SAM-dependent methyltransferase